VRDLGARSGSFGGNARFDQHIVAASSLYVDCAPLPPREPCIKTPNGNVVAVDSQHTLC
jgi:hypothetical protein